MCTFSPPERYPLARDAPAPPRKRPSKAFSGAKSAWAGTSTSVVRVGVFLHLSGGRGPDGMAMDQSGGVAVAHVDFGAVWIFSHRGEALYRVQSCRTDMVTNVAYKGDELYITTRAAAAFCGRKCPLPDGRSTRTSSSLGHALCGGAGMKTTTLFALAAAVALAAAAGCDRNTEVSKKSSSPEAGAGASAPRESSTPSTPANIGPPQTPAERQEGAKPVQGQIDPKQDEQRRDFRTPGEGAGPRGGGG